MPNKPNKHRLPVGTLALVVLLLNQNNQTTTSNFPCNFNFAVSNMNRFNQGIYHG